MISVSRLESLGIDGDQRGNEYVAACPAHRERTGKVDGSPSWSINLDKGVFHCFSCHWSGTFATLVAYLGGDLEAGDTRPVDERIASVMSDLHEVRANLYLRPINDAIPETSLDVFEEPPTWACKARDVNPSVCADIGVRWNPRDNSWILPIRNSFHDLMGWQIKGQGSRLFRNFPTGIKKGESLFAYDQSTGSEFTVVVESPLDAVRLLSFGIPAVATYGASVSTHQANLLSYFPLVIAAFDNDEAGRAATKKLRACKASINFNVLQYPTGAGKDPGEMDRALLVRAIKTAPHFLRVM